jgi:hypothetical protein
MKISLSGLRKKGEWVKPRGIENGTSKKWNPKFYKMEGAD